MSISSYLQKQLNYGDLLKSISFLIQPTSIVEFGILNGFSIDCFLETSPNNCKIEAFDIFDEFIGNHAQEEAIKKKYKNNTRVSIEKLDFFNSLDRFSDSSIDLLHVDIANTGIIVPYIQMFMRKIRPGGVILLEGGSKERDQITWMEKYKKKPLCPALKQLVLCSYVNFGEVPSLTIIRPEFSLLASTFNLQTGKISFSIEEFPFNEQVKQINKDNLLFMQEEILNHPIFLNIYKSFIHFLFKALFPSEEVLFYQKAPSFRNRILEDQIAERIDSIHFNVPLTSSSSQNNLQYGVCIWGNKNRNDPNPQVIHFEIIPGSKWIYQKTTDSSNISNYYGKITRNEVFNLL